MISIRKLILLLLLFSALILALAYVTTVYSDPAYGQTVTSVNGEFTLKLWNSTSTINDVTVTGVCGEYVDSPSLTVTHCGFVATPEFGANSTQSLLPIIAAVLVTVVLLERRRTRFRGIREVERLE